MAHIVGLDIGNTAVRAALIRTGFRKVEVVRYLSIPLAQASDRVAKPVEVGEAVRMLWRSFGQAPDSVVADLPGDRVSLRTLTLPAAAVKHIAEVLPFELDSLLPFSTEAAVIDYQMITRGREEIKLLVAAALREQVEERLKELRTSGIEPRSLAAGAAALDALTLVVPELRQEGPVLIADVGYDHTDLCILRAGVCQSARTLSAGVGSLPGRPSEELWRGIQRTVAAYRSEGGPPITCVYVAGAVAVTGATTWISETLKLPVEVLPLPLTPEVDAAVLPLFSRAAALACCGAFGGRHINVRGGELALQNAASTLRRSAGLLGICATALFLSIIFSLYARKTVLTEERDGLRTGLASLTKQVFGTVTSDPGKVEKLIAGNLAEDPLPRFDGFDSIDAISSMIPSEVTHDVMRLLVEVGDFNREGKLELRGTLSSIEQRDALAALMAKNGCFKEIKTGRTSPAREPERINYQIEAAIRCPAEGTSSKAKTIRRRSE